MNSHTYNHGVKYEYYEKFTWKEILFLIPLIPAILYSTVYLYLIDFLMGEDFLIGKEDKEDKEYKEETKIKKRKKRKIQNEKRNNKHN